jgi:hypothetical protein
MWYLKKKDKMKSGAFYRLENSVFSFRSPGSCSQMMIDGIVSGLKSVMFSVIFPEGGTFWQQKSHP